MRKKPIASEAGGRTHNFDLYNENEFLKKIMAVQRRLENSKILQQSIFQAIKV
jgi:hypothetical protein